MAGSKEIIECSFSLFNEGRVYSGHHRKYVLESAQEVAVSGPTKEKLRDRELWGYYGHGRRVLSGKLAPGEVEAVKLPDGSTVLVNMIASNVTTAFEVNADGTVKHSQEVLDTEPGKIVSALNRSHVGGFSWACGGGEYGGTTRVTRFEGFDYVRNPGFNSNRGYILESAGDPATDQMVLESIAAVVGDDAKAEQYAKGWLLEAQHKAMILEEALFDSEAAKVELLDQLQGKEKDFADLDAQAKAAVEAQAKAETNTKAVLQFITESAPFFIPEEAMHQMMNGDFSRAKTIFESAKRVDFNQYPIPGQKGTKTSVKPEESKPAVYGSAESAWTL